MLLGISLVVIVVVVCIIVAFFLLRPGGGRYARMADKELRSQNYIPPSPEDRPRSRMFRTPDGDSNLTQLVIGIIRVAIGLAALIALTIIFTSTQNSLTGVTNDAKTTAIYAAGIFKAAITIGIAGALYIFTRFYR